MINVRLNVNDEEYEIMVAPHHTLCDVLRDKLGFTDVKNGCSEGECGSCTVLVDGKPFCSCLMLALQANGRKITTVRGLSKDGELHPLQQKFIQHGEIENRQIGRPISFQRKLSSTATLSPVKKR